MDSRQENEHLDSDDTTREQRKNAMSSLSREPVLESGLTIRQLSKGGDFIRAVHCAPGRITVISGEDGTGYQPFRDALLGRVGPIPVDVRLAGGEFNVSQVYLVGLAHYLWNGETVREVLRKAGISTEEVVGASLKVFGLEHVIDLAPTGLTECELRRLAILCALFSSAKILLFDRPFKPLAPDWHEIIAALMLERIKNASQVVVVTGIDHIPEMWKLSPWVKLERVEFGRKKTQTFSAAPSDDNHVLSTVRTMMAAHRGTKEKEADGVFRTYPQAIHRPVVRAAVPEALQTEAIQNPNLGKLLPTATADDSVVAEHRASGKQVVFLGSGDTKGLSRKDSAVRKRSAAKRLTKVTVMEKIHYQWPLVSFFRRMMNQYAGEKSSLSSSLPPSAKLILKRKEQKQRKVFAQVITAVFAIAAFVAVTWWVS